MRLLVLALLLGSSLRLGAATNPPPANAELVQAQTCLKRLRVTVDDLAGLEKIARSTGQTARADRLKDYQANLAVLLGIVESAQARLLELAASRDTAGMVVQSASITAACKLADTLTDAAEDLRGAAPQKPGAVPAEAPPTNHRAPIEPADRPATSSVRPADPRTCLRQKNLACLLMQAMDLVAELPPPSAPCLEVLTRRHISPPGGWSPDQCTTLDDFCAVVAGVLHLEGHASGTDPASYVELLRVAGLPVDALLPPRTEAGAPLVEEAAVRAFLACGYAPVAAGADTPPPSTASPAPSWWYQPAGDGMDQAPPAGSLENR